MLCCCRIACRHSCFRGFHQSRSCVVQNGSWLDFCLWGALRPSLFHLLFEINFAFPWLGTQTLSVPLVQYQRVLNDHYHRHSPQWILRRLSKVVAEAGAAFLNLRAFTQPVNHGHWSYAICWYHASWGQPMNVQGPRTLSFGQLGCCSLCRCGPSMAAFGVWSWLSFKFKLN